MKYLDTTYLLVLCYYYLLKLDHLNSVVFSFPAIFLCNFLAALQTKVEIPFDWECNVHQWR